MQIIVTFAKVRDKIQIEMIKAIFFDIDGTLLSFKTHTVSDSTVRALDELRRRDIRTFIATGRPLAGINHLDGLRFDGYITLNGGYCLAGGEDGKRNVIYKNPIDPSDIEALIRYQQEGNTFSVMYVMADQLYINHIDEKASRIFELLDFPVPQQRPLEAMLGEEVFQLVSFIDAQEEIPIMRDVLTHCDAARWNPLFADVIPRGNSKQRGIDQIINHYGIRLEETMSFGDGGNDIPMLQHTALSVAMGNAADEVKRSAKYVTDTVDNDGIAKALQHFGIL